MKAIYVMGAESFSDVYPSNVRKEIARVANVFAPPQTTDSIRLNLSLLEEAEVIFSGWGAPKLDEKFLAAAPNLKAFFYAAGSLKGIVTDHCWERNITVSSAYAANAIPVAEYTLSQILFSLKHGWHYAFEGPTKYQDRSSGEIPGAFGSTVGIISLGMVGRRVCELLKQSFDINVIAYDPFVSESDASMLGVELCSLEEVFSRADVVSLHTPWLKETEGMITGAHFELMKPQAAFINTARGAVVRETEMIEVLTRRADLISILDVTYPEPPNADSKLYSLPNVILTPHIAGSQGNECNRMGAYMLDEFKRYIKGDSLQWQVTQKSFTILA